MHSTPYPSDLTDAQWERLAPLIPPAKPGGRPRSVNLRALLNASLSWSRTGCQWRQLPHDLPPWGTVHYDHWRWRVDGTWERIHARLREEVRTAAGRQGSPSAAILESQSVKTTEKGGRAATTPAKR
jgi:transposase